MAETRTPLAPSEVRQAITFAQRDTPTPFRVWVDPDPVVYDDPEFVLTIRLEMVDEKGNQRGSFSTFTGHPQGKARRWGRGLLGLPEGVKTTITVEANKPAKFAVELQEWDRKVQRADSIRRV